MPKPRRSKIFPLRLTRGERMFLEENASRQGITPTELLRKGAGLSTWRRSGEGDPPTPSNVRDEEQRVEESSRKTTSADAEVLARREAIREKARAALGQSA